MQRSNGLPLPKDSERSLYKAAAQGCIGAPPGPAARSCSSRLSAARQSPDRSGLPSTAFGAGADTIGLPSGVRGVFGSFTFTHCANAATFIAKTIAASRGILMLLLYYYRIWKTRRRNPLLAEEGRRDSLTEAGAPGWREARA